MSSWKEIVSKLSPPHHAYAEEWKQIISNSFGHKPYYLEVPGAVAPLFFINNPLFGKALISVPYLNAGGVLAESDEAYFSMFKKIEALAEELDVSYVELRELDERVPKGWEVKSHKVSMLLELKADEDEQFGAFPSKLRSQIRRPGKEGVETKRVEDVSDFYKVFSENMRDLGTPVYPIKFLKEIILAFGDRSRFYVSYLNKKPIAAGFTINQSGYIEIPLASSLRAYNKVSANMQMYWEVIKDAVNQDGAYFDFGRSSPDAGTFKFKKQWGSQPKPLHWKYFVRKGDIPEVNPNSPKFALAVKCWKKLPLPVANIIGPQITKMLP